MTDAKTKAAREYLAKAGGISIMDFEAGWDAALQQAESIVDVMAQEVLDHGQFFDEAEELKKRLRGKQ